MDWFRKIWSCVVGSPEECSIHDPEIRNQVKGLVKRAFAVGFITGLLACSLLYKGLAP